LYSPGEGLAGTARIHSTASTVKAKDLGHKIKAKDLYFGLKD